MIEPAKTPFLTAKEQLSGMGIVLKALAGEYEINYKDGRRSTARYIETLDEALAAGQEMALTPMPEPLPPLGPCGRGNTRRCMIMRHNRKIADERRRQAEGAQRKAIGHPPRPKKGKKFKPK